LAGNAIAHEAGIFCFPQPESKKLNFYTFFLHEMHKMKTSWEVKLEVLMVVSKLRCSRF
jgi:hypothetical protein